MKTCIDCNQDKDLSDFPSRGAGGRKRPYCKACYNVRQKEYRDKNREAIRASWSKASAKYYTYEGRRAKTLQGYGLNEQTYQALFELQGGACAICQRVKPLVIDHCHTTGVVRGLLCQRCNTSIGGLGDTVEGLQRAIEYLNAAG